MSPLVSIIMPSYNSGESVSMTIESVLNQTYRNWEMLIIDDSSSDNSSEIIKKFIRKDKRIQYFCTDSPSGSPSLPRNIGINHARGQFIAFLDSDDLWLPDKLEIQIDFLEKWGYDLAYSFYEKMDWDGKRNNRIIRTRRQSTYATLLMSNSIPCLTSIISRKALGETRFKQIPQEDFCFWLDILKKGYTAYNVGELTALYREAKGSRSANKLEMFKGYWNVIRNHQNIGFLPSCLYMLTYSFLGVLKYLK